MPKSIQKVHGGGGGPGGGAGEAVLRVPAALRECRVEWLLLGAPVTAALARRGVAVLGDLEGWSAAELDARLSPHQARLVREVLAPLVAVPRGTLERLSAGAEGALPRLGAAPMLALAGARTLEEEARALLAGVSPRNAEFVLRRWCLYGPSQPSLEAVGEPHGLTRERVRQIVEREEARVAAAGVRLPLAARLVEMLEEAGGMLLTEVLVERARGAGLVAGGDELCILPTLHRLGLVPEVQHLEEYGLWVSERGRAAWLNPKRLRELRRRTMRELRRTGAVGLVQLSPLSPAAARVALRLGLPPQRDVAEVGGYLVPFPPMGSSVVRAVEKMLAVTPCLEIREVRRGLRQVGRTGEGAPLPPEVLIRLLGAHPGFRVERGLVSLAHPRPRAAALSAAERVVVGLVEESGGEISRAALVHGVRSAGFSLAMAKVLLRKPFLQRVGPLTYALRGRRTEAPERARAYPAHRARVQAGAARVKPRSGG